MNILVHCMGYTILKIIFHLNSNLTKCSSFLFAKFGDLTNNPPTGCLTKEPPLLTADRHIEGMSLIQGHII